MLKSLRGIGFLLVAVLALPVFAADEKKDKKKKEGDADPKEAKEAKPEKPSYGLKFVATVTKVSATSQKEFTVQIKYQELNQQAYLSYQQQLAAKQQQVAVARTPQARQQAIAQLIQYSQQPPQNLITIKTKDIELRATDEIKVRSLQPPIDYDDKGNVKKYTKKELAELKGADKTLPGYTADFEAIQAKQVVKVYLAKDSKAGAKKVMKKKKAKKKKKDEDVDDDDSLEDESKLVAAMVVIVAEPRLPKE
jgi:hypothetical protein